MNPKTFLLLFYQLLAHCQGEISINSLPSPLNVVVGSTFALSCNYRPHTFHSWLHPTIGEVVQSTEHLILQVSSQAKQAILVVNTPTRYDGGEYVCRATNENHAIVTASVNASLFEHVQIITPSMLTYQATLCETVALNCNSLHHDFVIWRKLSSTGVTIREVSNSSDGHLTVLPDHLVIHETRPSDNGTYTCSVGNAAGHKYITANLHIDPLFITPPENITSSVSVVEHGGLPSNRVAILVLMWSPVTSDLACTVQYKITTNNCGVCPNVSNHTTAVCNLINLSTNEQVCDVVLQAQVDGIINSNTSVPYTIKLKVPGTPLFEAIPYYAFSDGQLIAVHVSVIIDTTTNMTLENDDILRETSYTVNITDSTSGSSCGYITVQASSCMDGSCDCVFEMSSSMCPSSTDINITAFGTNTLGNGPPSSPLTISSFNSYLHVNICLSYDVVYCDIIFPQIDTLSVCSIAYSFVDPQQDNLCQEYEATTNFSTNQNHGILISNLNEELLNSFQFCFKVTAFFQSFVIAVQGNYVLDSSSTTFLPENVEELDPQILTVAVVSYALCVTMIIVVCIINVIIVRLILKKKWNRAQHRCPSNINELNEITRACTQQDLENEFKGNLVYADVVASAGPIATQIYLDDDRMEYAKIDHNTCSDLKDSAVKINRHNQASELLIHHQPLNLDTLLITLHPQATPKWYQFGKALGIDEDHLELLHSSFPAEQAIVEMLDHWLRNDMIKPSWRDVGRALKKVELSDLGEEVLNMYT